MSGRRVTVRPCTECPNPIENAGTSTHHRSCHPAYLSRMYAEKNPPDAKWTAAQSEPPANGAPNITFAPMDFEPQRIVEKTEPFGRPSDDPRNNARFNNRRDAGEQVMGQPFMSPIRVGVLDIETTGLNAGFGVILCAVLKVYGPDERHVISADQFEPWHQGIRSNDRPLLVKLLAAIEDVDIIVAHNGLKFDMPFIRTRAVFWGLPAVAFQKIVDPVQIARQHFRFSGNSLDSISRLIGTKCQKTPLSPTTWQHAALDGNIEALREIEEHCIADVDVLEEVMFKLRGYVKTIDRAGSYMR